MEKRYRFRTRSRCKNTANQTDPSPWTVVAQQMNQSAYPPRAASVHWAGVRLVLTLLPVVATSAPSVAPELSSDAMSRPYLSAIGSPALRFGEAIPPPDLTVRPPAGPPPQLSEEHSAVTPEVTKQDVTVTAPPPGAAVEIGTPDPSRSAPAKIPAAILPDDTRPKVRAEDFLPFFQFPGNTPANGDVTVVAPVPTAPTAAPLPASSATYRQQ